MGTRRDMSKENGGIRPPPATTVGPHGEVRPRDVIANAVHVARIATGEIEETYAPRSGADGPRTRNLPVRETERSTKLSYSPSKGG